METIERCSICQGRVELGGGYVVRIDVYADPELPPMTAQQLESANFHQTLAEVIEQAGQMTADELQDAVHRRFEYRLCPSCHRRYLANPLGMPRVVRQGKN